MSWFVGLDPSTRAVGLAAIHENGELRHQTLHASGEFVDRLVWLRAEIRRWLAPYADDGAWCVVVERPGTRYGGAALLASYGVALEAARSMLPCPIVDLGSSSWKAISVGTGGADKVAVMSFARTLGYDGSSQDAADAIGCAAAARALVDSQLRGAA